MSAPRWDEILFDSALMRLGVPFRRFRTDGTEPEAYTHTRADAASCATYLDRDGVPRTAAANKLRCSWNYATTRPGLLLEGARTNRALYSQDASNWSAAGTPALATSSLYGMLFQHVTDNDAGAAEYHYRAYAANALFGADGVNAVSVDVIRGDTPPTGGSRIQIEDNTAAANRLLTVLTWSGNAPSLAMTAGTYLGYESLGTAHARLYFATTSGVLKANNHTVYVLPCDVASATGDLYWTQFQVEGGAYPTSRILTTSAAVTRAADALTFPIGFGPQDLTVYVRMPPPVWAPLAGAVSQNIGVYDIGNAVTAHQWLYADLAAGTFVAGFYGTSAVSASVAIPTSGTVELVVQLDLANQMVRIAKDATFSAWSSAGGALSAWATYVLKIGDTVNTPELDGAIERLVVARGLFTLAEMQAAPAP